MLSAVDGNEYRETRQPWAINRSREPSGVEGAQTVVVGRFSISSERRCIKEMRIIDAERREFRPIFSVTVSSNEGQHILT
jgi:hypothetical protein